MTVSRSKNADKNAATKIHAAIIRHRGVCERCRGTRYLQCAHIVGRTYSATRTDLDNAWCLCATCHRDVDTHWDEKRDLVKNTIGMARYSHLKRKATAHAESKVQFNWADERTRLGNIAKRTGVIIR